MNFHMGVKVARLGEGLATYQALVGLLTSVGPSVNIEYVFPRESPSTIFAFEWSFIGVLALEMIFQMTLSCEVLVADSATVRLKSKVVVDMVLQACLLIVELTTAVGTDVFLSSVELFKWSYVGYVLT